jgi:hypothetical protein
MRFCPADALFVAPDLARATPVHEHVIAAAGLFGSYRESGWAMAPGADRPMDQSFRLSSAG